MTEYKYLGKLQALSITCILTALVLSHKMVMLLNIQFSVASFIFPNTLLIANIVTIVYGYTYSNKIMWETLKCQIPFTLICLLAIRLPSPISIGNAAYEYVFNDMWQISLASLIGTYVGQKANTYALSKFDVLLLYKGFWLQTLFACGVGEFIFTIIAVPLMFFNKVSFYSLSSIIATSLLVKLIYSSILSYFSQCVAIRLIKSENIELENSSFNYDPFIAKALQCKY